jgi:hypothetical protein
LGFDDAANVDNNEVEDFTFPLPLPPPFFANELPLLLLPLLLLFFSSSVCLSGLEFRLAGTAANALASAANRSNPSDAIYSFKSVALLLFFDAELDDDDDDEDAIPEEDDGDPLGAYKEEVFDGMNRADVAEIVGFRGGLSKSGVYCV